MILMKSSFWLSSLLASVRDSYLVRKNNKYHREHSVLQPNPPDLVQGIGGV